jgi:hypothetical protein
MAGGAWWMVFVWLALFGLLWWAWSSSVKIQRSYLKWIIRIIVILILAVTVPTFFITCLGIGPIGCM